MKNKLQQELNKFSEIPKSISDSYYKNISLMVDKVNKELTAREDIEKLIANNPRDLILDYNHHHAALINVLTSLNIFYILPDNLQWMYRLYRNRGVSSDYLKIFMNTWRKVLKEDFSHLNLSPIVNLYDWIISHHDDFVQLSEQGTPFSSMESISHAKNQRDRYVEALLEGDRNTILELSNKYVRKASDINKFYREIIQPSMYRIGELWENNVISVSKEHLSSALVNTIISSQYIKFMENLEPWRGKALITAASNEFHVIGAQMVANCLDAEGWEVDYLGANIPMTDLMDHLRGYRPQIIGISVAMHFNLEKTKRIIDEIRNEFKDSCPKIMLGGLAFYNQPELPYKAGADGYAKDCHEAVELSKEWYKELQ